MSQIITDQFIQQKFSSFFLDENGKYVNHLPPKVLETAFNEKLFKCFLPVGIGGLGLGIRETLDIIEQASYVNGSLGWLIQIGNGGNYFAAYFDDETRKKLFGGSNSVLAGSGASTGIATPVEDGFMVTGSWKYCSGADYASFFTFNCVVEGTEEIVSVAILNNQVNIIHDWKTTGLKFTSTHSVKVENIFVPFNQCFNLQTRKGCFDISIFDFPFLAYAQFFFISNLYGMCQRYLDEAEKIANKDANYWNAKFSSRNIIFKKLHDSASNKLQESKLEVKNLLKLMEKSSHKEKEPLAGTLAKKVVNDKELIMGMVHEIFPLLGMQAVYEDNVACIFYQDINCLGQHILLNKYFFP